MSFYNQCKLRYVLIFTTMLVQRSFLHHRLSIFYSAEVHLLRFPSMNVSGWYLLSGGWGGGVVFIAFLCLVCLGIVFLESPFLKIVLLNMEHQIDSCFLSACWRNKYTVFSSFVALINCLSNCPLLVIFLFSLVNLKFSLSHTFVFCCFTILCLGENVFSYMLFEIHWVSWT